MQYQNQIQEKKIINIPHEYRFKNSQQSIYKLNQVIYKKNNTSRTSGIYSRNGGLVQHLKSISKVYHIKSLKNKICTIISIDAGKEHLTNSILINDNNDNNSNNNTNSQCNRNRRELPEYDKPSIKSLQLTSHVMMKD